ncbi:MAG: hypothetical protein ACP5HU_12745 [Phycisphaerae bacterium]
MSVIAAYMAAANQRQGKVLQQMQEANENQRKILQEMHKENRKTGCFMKVATAISIALAVGVFVLSWVAISK